MRDVADLAGPGARIAEQLARLQQALLQNEFGEGRSGLLEQALCLARAQARARGNLGQAEIVAAKCSHHVGAHEIETGRRMTSPARKTCMLGVSAEQEPDEIDHVLRGEALADGVEMRRVMGRKGVVAEDRLGDRAVREHLRQLVLGAWTDVEECAARHADGGEPIFLGVAHGAGDAHVDEHHLRGRKLHGMAVLPNADETRVCRDQDEIVAAVGKVALGA